MKTIYRVFVAFAILLLTACASSSSLSVPSELLDSASTVHVLATTDHSGLKLQFLPSISGGTAGGAVAGPVGMILGSAIDKAENKNRAVEADTKITPYRDMLGALDVQSLFSNSVITKISGVDLGSAPEVHTLSFSKTVKNEDYLATNDADSLIVLRSEYSLSPDFDVLNVGVLLSIYDSNKMHGEDESTRPVRQTYIQHQSKRLNPVWQLLNTEEVESRIAATSEEYDQKMSKASIGLRKFYRKEMKEKMGAVRTETLKTRAPDPLNVWNRELLEAEILHGTERVSDLVVMYLNDRRTTQDYEPFERQIPMINILGDHSQFGIIAHEFAKFSDAVAYRTSDGNLFSVPSGEILKKHALIQ